MVGFFGKYSKKMTESSEHYLDWSRVGSLLQSKNYRYSNNDLLVRAGVIAGVMSGGIIGYRQSNSHSYVNHSLWAMAGCFVGFVVSHSIVIAPLIHKRYVMSHDCKLLQEKIVHELSEHEKTFEADNKEEFNCIFENIKLLMNGIMGQSLSNELHGNASLTWGRRRKQLINLEKALKESILDFSKSDLTLNELSDFWKQEEETLLKSLNTEVTDFKLTNEMPVASMTH